MLYQVDSFTNEVFKGNPAGVYISEKPLSNEFMQNIALEMNLSETAFTWIENNERQIRFFTPIVEVPLCGHATLATAHILWELGIETANEIILQAKSDEIKTFKTGDFISFVFPRINVTETSFSLSQVIDQEVTSNFETEIGWHVCLLNDEQSVQSAQVNLEKLVKEDRVLILTAPGTSKDFVLRVFAPTAGIPEDPATGFAQTIVAPLWSNILAKKSLTSKQLSKRVGLLNSEVGKEKVSVSGQAVTVFKLESRV